MRTQGHAVVIGASMAGLVAARTLADHFERVTIIERDRLPSGPDIRGGVPQARHVHVLLLRGTRLLERLFPGLDAELAAAGASRLDWTGDAWLYNLGAWKPHFASGLSNHQCSRALLEWTVRGRVLANPRVVVREQTDVTGLVTDGHGRATGVRVRPRRRSDEANPGADEPARGTVGEADGEAPGPDGRGEIVAADLVVGAAGRDAKSSQWVADLGYPEPEMVRVNAHLGYATRFYQPPSGFQAPWKALVVAASPPASRGAVLMPVEGDRWIVTLAGTAGDYPPTDEEGFVAFARSLPVSTLADAIEQAMPLSSIVGYRRTENVRRDYARLNRFVEGFISIGDAVCAFNPVYGQGMTVAAHAAVVLDACLREQPDLAAAPLTGLARRYHRRVGKIIGDPWTLATGEDLRYPETTGADQSLAMRILRPYLDQVLMVATDDPAAYRTVVEVIHLLKPPLTLFRPAILARVLPHLIRRRHA